MDIAAWIAASSAHPLKSEGKFMLVLACGHQFRGMSMLQLVCIMPPKYLASAGA